jgi:hypothetical protein
MQQTGRGGIVMPRTKNNSKKQKPPRTKKLKQTQLQLAHQIDKPTGKISPSALEVINETESNNDVNDLATTENRIMMDRNTKSRKGKKYLQIKLHTDIDSNDHYGDNIFDQHNHEIILFHNINGIKDETNWFQIITTMSELNTSIFGFAELNKSMTRGSLDWRSTLRKIYYYSRTSFSESSVQFDTDYKPGGTMTTITGKWQARVSEHGQDPKGLGRWSYQKISSRQKLITFVTAYRPCHSQGPSTSWTQQWIILRESGSPNPNPIQQFYTGLEEFLSTCKTSVLMIDANEHIGEKPGGLTTILG